jgi:disulfide bond formation protein DsbB|tara:strand:- start:572 stop:1054 length:483 start_codon:yes stop_codon:yes gene_type:complete
MFKIKNQKFLSVILLFSVFALISAYFIQYILGHQPCNLCLIQRIPYASAIIIISLCLFFKKFEKVSLIFLILIFLSATLLSFYHFGIEQGFIKESLVCNLNNGDKILTTEELLNELKEITISCKDVSFKILGLSLATINILISLVLTVITFKTFINHEKN